MEAVNSIRNTPLGVEQLVDFLRVCQVRFDSSCLRALGCLGLYDISKDEADVWRALVCDKSAGELCKRDYSVSIDVDRGIGHAPILQASQQRR